MLAGSPSRTSQAQDCSLVLDKLKSVIWRTFKTMQLSVGPHMGASRCTRLRRGGMRACKWLPIPAGPGRGDH
jgi:hypothetical protein